MATRLLTEGTFEQTAEGDGNVLGILVFSEPGALPAPALDQAIAALRELDMDDVRARFAASKSDSAWIGSA